jgi:hypothetical protein
MAVDARHEVANILQDQQVLVGELHLECLLDHEDQVDVREGVPPWNVAGGCLRFDRQGWVVEYTLKDLCELLECCHRLSLVISVLHAGEVSRILAEHLRPDDPAHDLATSGSRQSLGELE